jgi:hypothetical protein
MTPRSILLAAPCLALLLAVPSAHAGGTHFLVEPATGLTFSHGLSLEDAVGLEAGAVLGVGGKFKGFPPRFYAYFRFSRSLFGEDEVYIASRDAHAEVNRAYSTVTGGLRSVIPLFWRLRLELEFGGGATFSQNGYRESGLPIRDYDETLSVLEFGAGLNVRLFRWLSLGLMYNYTMVVEEENGDLIASMLGEEDAGKDLGWSHLNLTLGFHF